CPFSDRQCRVCQERSCGIGLLAMGCGNIAKVHLELMRGCCESCVDDLVVPPPFEYVCRERRHLRLALVVERRRSKLVCESASSFKTCSLKPTSHDFNGKRLKQAATAHHPQVPFLFAV